MYQNVLAAAYHSLLLTAALIGTALSANTADEFIQATLDSDIPAALTATSKLTNKNAPLTPEKPEFLKSFFAGMGNTALPTPLILAAYWDRHELVKKLLEDPAVDVNVATVDGVTALHAAIAAGSVEVTQLLLTKGADTRKKFTYRRTDPKTNQKIIETLDAQEFAQSNAVRGVDDIRMQIIIVLIERQLQGTLTPKTPTPPEEKPTIPTPPPVTAPATPVFEGVIPGHETGAWAAAVTEADQKRAQELLSYIPLNAQMTSFRTTPQSDTLAQVLESREAPTPLAWAAFMGDIKMLTLLLKQHNIDVNAANKVGVTALHAAIAGKHPEIVKILLENGADPKQAYTSTTMGATTLISKSITPLQLAKNLHNTEIQQLLENPPSLKPIKKLATTNDFQAIDDTINAFSSALAALKRTMENPA